ncbi:hypothetical protein BGX30_001553, partial [Mortierella sp. GBA39]
MNSTTNGTESYAPEICGRIFSQGCRKNESRSQYDEGRSQWRDVNISYAIATSYLAMITLVALVMYVRNRTRLRLIVVIFSILGLSSGIAGFLSTTRFHGSYKTDERLQAHQFWIWYFACEGLGTAILAWTVVKVGTVFYSQAGRKNIFYVLSIVMILVFATLAIANLVVYITQVTGNTIRGTTANRYQLCISYMENCIKIFPASYRPSGYDWRMFVIKSWRDDQKNPSREVYLPNQVLTAVTFLWVSMYLFVPLLRNQKHRPVIGSDMTAVGIWYLSCLSILVSVYMALTIWSCFQVDPKILYQPWISAVDVCLRGTIGIVFSLPAPKFIIQFARQYYGHQRKEGDSSRIPRNIISRQRGMFSSSMNYSQDFGGNFSNDRSPVTTLGTTAKAGASIEDPLGYLENHSNRSNNMNFGSIKLFPTRNRGESMESSKVFNQDFEPEDLHDEHLSGDEGHTSDSFQQYYSKVDNAIPNVMSRGLNSLTTQDAQEKDVLSSGHKVEEPQRPAPALTVTRSTEKQAVRSWNIDSQAKPCQENITAPPSSAQESTIQQHNKGAASEPRLIPEAVGESVLQPSARGTQEVLTSKSIGITGTTGWEVGGWGHPRGGSDTSTANPAHSRDDSNASNVSLAHPLEKKLYRQDLVYNVGDGTVSVLPELTGLQKQLAQHQSSLLPSAIAIQHYDPAENCPPALRAQMEAAFTGYIESLPPDVDIDGRIRLAGHESDLITADSDDLKMTRHLNERFRIYQQNHNSFAYDRAYWIKHPPS